MAPKRKAELMRESRKLETLVIETIDSIVCEQRKSDSQNYSESIPNDDVIDSNLLTEIQSTSYTNSVEPKGWSVKNSTNNKRNHSSSSASNLPSPSTNKQTDQKGKKKFL
ncbi:uncharacterized protein LOC112680181 isoform X2 [Sipha flava]|uniref:Uncharacterized protein LOC112680181 isoform X2 n=1 Tax=Sipha flava TaxID=143950 RepID=A0A8B8F652_9HEMI|nr:uncharacterized protein LOC112680181 isoform X2 [Sipha flava]